MEFLSFRAESEEIEEHGRRIHIKFKKDQNAVKELCSGVRNERVKHKIVPYSERYSDKVDWEIKNFINLANGKELKFTDSSVYLSVPPSNIKFVGYDSEYLRVSNPAQITFHAKDNGELNISLFIKGVSSNVISYRFRSHAMIRTANGAFEISLDGQQAAAGYPWLYKEEYIAPKDMDVLLSSPVEVVVYVEKHE